MFILEEDVLKYKAPLSPYSKIFYNEWSIDPNRNDYNIVFDQNIEGILDVAELKNAIQGFITEHLLLNSCVKEIEGELFWVPREIENTKHALEYYTELSDEEIIEYIKRPFNLKEGPLYRFAIIKYDQYKYRFVTILHHIVIDGSSFDYFIKALSVRYSVKKHQNNFSIKEQYACNKNLSEKLLQKIELVREKGKVFWEEQLSEIDPLDLKFLQFDYNKNEVELGNIEEIRFNFAQDILSKLKKISKNYEISPYFFGQCVYAILLYRYTGQDKFGIAYPVRIKEGMDFIYGAHINTNIMLYDFRKHRNILELFTHAKTFISSLKNDLEYRYLPIYDIIASSNKNILNVSFAQTNLKNLSFRFSNSKAIINNKTNIDLPNVLLFEQELHKNKLCYRVRWRSDKISNLLISRFIEHYKRLFVEILDELVEVVNQPRSIAYYDLLSKDEYIQVVCKWNATDRDYPANKTIHELFEEQVERTPDNIAIVYEETKLTYRELNDRSNQLAHYIRANHDIKPDTLIALCLDRSEHMLIGILAVLKAGAAYVPMDPSYPDDRMQHIIEDTNTKLILANEIYKERLEEIVGLQKNSDTKVLDIDAREVQEQLNKESKANLKTETSSKDLAYVIYTSGTTGQPKGVMIEHCGCVIRILYMINKNEIAHTDRMLFKTNYVFDVSFSDIFCTFISGALICITKETFNVDEILSKIKKYKISICHFVPSQFNTIINDEFSFDKNALQKLMFSGEALDIKLFKNFSEKDKIILNYYGPTETGEVVVYKFNSNDIGIKEGLNKNISVIGKAFDCTTTYVLDVNLRPLPIGAIGELYIGGAGLARGYLNRPELTAERFIKNPFQTVEEKNDISYGDEGRNARVYKTGDLVRWLPDGNLEYIGRNDFQVKIRGYRIELEEIENALSSYDGIKQNVVLAKEHIDTLGNETGTKYLVSYYVSEAPLNEEEILSYLRNKLPDYMIPSAFVYLEQLPLTINGKLDRKALPDPSFTNINTYIAPRNELEEQVVGIWAEVLGLAKESIGIQDDFFRLGGNSILAIQLVSKINKDLNKNLRVASIFKNTTILRLISSLEGEIEENVITKIIVADPKDQKLSFAQERLWFIEKYEEGTSAYNIPMICKLSKDINFDALESSLKSMVGRHEILRTVIKEDDGNVYQKVLDIQDNPLEILKIEVKDQLELEEHLQQEIKHIYDLSYECPIRISFYELRKKRSLSYDRYLSIVIHHIVFDGWSTEIFLKELQDYYGYYLDLLEGRDSVLKLPELSIQYKDFALWQRNYLTGERLNTQLSYWKNKLDGYETLNLITDMPRPKEIDYRGGDVSFEIDENTSEDLRSLAKELKVSLYSLLLSGYYLMLRSYTNQEDIVIGTPIANRHYSQIENIIGFFVNTLALRIKIDTKERVKDYIERIGKEIKEAQLYQDLPFEKLIEELNIDKDTSRHAIFQVMFGVQSFGYGSKVMEEETKNLNKLLEPYTGDIKYGVAQFDLSTILSDQNVKITGKCSYAESLYKQKTIERFVETYLYILRQLSELAGNLDKLEQIRLNDLNYLSEEKYKEIIKEWNARDREYPDNKTIHELFEEQVEKTPDNIAIVYENTKLTYRELNERANQLGRYLKKLGVEPATLIAIAIKPSLELIIGLLGVLKSGGAYVPMDPDYPTERMQFILDDTQAPIVITDKSTNEKIPATFAQIISLDEEWGILNKNPSDNIISCMFAHNLAYVIYTSGTVGTPKGVVVEHRGVVSLVKNVDYVNIDSSDSFIQLANIAFDAATFEIWAPLLNGATLFIPSHKIDLIDNIVFFQKTLIENKISVLWLTKTLFDHMFFMNSDIFRGIKYLLIGGEALNREIIFKLISLETSPQNVINGYGPTENTTFSCALNINKSNIKDVISIPIGIPITNRKAYVMDADLRPLPIGAIGELYVGGAGLARGYLNRPELTAERFIKNPFQTAEERNDISYGDEGRNARVYKTGDLVCWLPDGNLEYIGRNDFQVKIRGYRIELEEIENILSNYNGIKQSVVLVKEHVDIDQLDNRTTAKYLVSYYVSEAPLNEEEILSYLRNKLPDYMIPSAFVYLEQLPLTINGKLDRKALPDSSFTNVNIYIAPRNKLEKRVVEIWAEVLGLAGESIGIHDDFFRLGGDSILAIRIIGKINKEFNSQIKVRDLFELKCISKIGENITYIDSNKTVDIYVPFSLINEEEYKDVN